MNNNRYDLSNGSIDLFTDLVRWSADWSGQPLIELTTAAEKGHLTDLKKKGLLRTFASDGCMFAVFTPEGIAFAKDLGLDTSAME